MTYALAYWVCMLIWIVFGFITNWPAPGPNASRFAPIGGQVLLFILFVLIGLAIFGKPLHE